MNEGRLLTAVVSRGQPTNFETTMILFSQDLSIANENFIHQRIMFGEDTSKLCLISCSVNLCGAGLQPGIFFIIN